MTPEGKRRPQIEHDIEAREFVLSVPEGQGTLAYTPAGEGVVDFVSTYVPHHLRGKGYAEALVVEAFNWARKEKLKVIPSCWFVGVVVKRKPEYKDLIQ